MKKKSYTVSLEYKLARRLQAIKKIKKGEVDIGYELYIPILKKVEELEKKFGIKPDCWKYYKNCPKCVDGTLMLRNGSESDFLGCSNFPKCKHTESLSKK